MTIEESVKVEEGLEKELTAILKNTRNTLEIQGMLTIYHKVKSKGMITSFFPIEDEKIPVADLFLKDKYARFHGEFTQTALTNPELKPLVDYLMNSGWDTNFD